MRALDLLGLAAEAEALRLRRIAGAELRLCARRGVALCFVGAAVALGHVAAWYALAPELGTVATALILAAADLAIALVLVLASRPGSGRVAEEAAALRTRLLREAAHDALRAPVHAIGGAVADAAVAALRRR